MKASEFYEKYWLINGQKPPPLRDAEKRFLDESVMSGACRAMFFRKRKRPVTINIDRLKEDMNKLPKYFMPVNQPKLDKYGQILDEVIPPLMISDKNVQEGDATDDDSSTKAG